MVPNVQSLICSANLCVTLIRENLIDEYRIGIAPVIAGKEGIYSQKGFPRKNFH
ncbi:dihydrofolate reductase family protein [Niastella populi]|uniref:dihydrofolate reductase family protein n=1 Tax=Niastella populi TaxID=550983 RepID=UPI0009BECF07